MKNKNPYRHPSNISLYNLLDKLNFPSVQGKTVLEVIELKSSFFEWALINSKVFCFDDYSYAYVKNCGLMMSSKAHDKQREKRLTFKNDTVKFNESYYGDEPVDIDPEVIRIRLYKPSYRIGFGSYSAKTIAELIEQSPSRLEFFIQELPWFGLTIDAINQLNNLQPNFIFLQSTFDLLRIKYDLAPQMMKGKRRSVNSEFQDHNESNGSDTYIIGDPRYDKNENPWIDVFGEGDEAETAYWNTN